MPKPIFTTDKVVDAQLADLVPVVPGGIVSRALVDAGDFKQVLFSMDDGQEISEHKAPYVATVHVLEGRLEFEVEGVVRDMRVGSWLLMPPNAPHRLRAHEPCRFLLTLIKGLKAPPAA